MIKTLFFQNIGIKQTVAKNIFWLALSEITPKTVTAALVVLIARYLGAEGFGRFSFAFAFVLLFSIITDFGLTTLTIKEVARDNLSAKKYIGNISAIKILLGFVTLAAIFVAVFFLSKPAPDKTLIYFAGVWLVIQGFTHFFQSIFRAFEKMEYEALSKIIYSLVLFFTVICVIALDLGIKSITQSYILAISVCLIFTFFLVKTRFIRFRFETDFLFWKKILKEAWAYAAFTVFAVIYFQISTVLLSIMDTDLSVGLYSIAFNSVVVFLILSDIVAGSALPALSKISSESALFKQLTQKLIKLLFVGGMLLAVALFFGASFFINALYGQQFNGAVVAFQVMVWILPVRFMNYLFGASLVAADLHKKRLNAAMVCALFNVLLNLILIPSFSFLGASFATLMTEFVLFFLYSRFYKKSVLKSL